MTDVVYPSPVCRCGSYTSTTWCTLSECEGIPLELDELTPIRPAAVQGQGAGSSLEPIQLGELGT